MNRSLPLMVMRREEPVARGRPAPRRRAWAPHGIASPPARRLAVSFCGSVQLPSQGAGEADAAQSLRRNGSAARAA